jgi:hypothetical protein
MRFSIIPLLRTAALAASNREVSSVASNQGFASDGGQGIQPDAEWLERDAQGLGHPDAG